MSYEAIPIELQALPQWCIAHDNDKAPKYSKGNGLLSASVSNPQTWMPFTEALGFAKLNEGTTGVKHYVGFVFTANDPYGCIDLDNKQNSEERKPEFAELIKRANSYTELSKSGTGYHIIVKGNIGKGMRLDSKGIEVYSQERFIIFTGNLAVDTVIAEGSELLNHLTQYLQPTRAIVDLPNPDPVDDDMTVLNRIQASAQGDKFRELFTNDWNTHGSIWATKYGYPSASEADGALAYIIAFYTSNHEQIERIFKMGKLYEDIVTHRGPEGRNKEPVGYLRRTVTSARQKRAQDIIKQNEERAQINMTGFMNMANKMMEDHHDQESEDPWGIPLPQIRPEAFHGILSYIAEVGSENSEAVPVALALNTLSLFAATLGRDITIAMGDDFKNLTFFTIVIGPSNYGRKGTSTKLPQRIFEEVELKLQTPFPLVTHGAINTGEGLVYCVRDATDEDEGVLDKRAYFQISEFSAILVKAKTEASILTQVIRDAFDGNNLQTLTKYKACKATKPHITISGHITKDEFLKGATKIDMVNGFLNRFFLMHSLRTKVVHDPQPVSDSIVSQIADALVIALQGATVLGQYSIPFTASGLTRFIELKIALDKPRSENVRALMVRDIVYLRMFAAAIALINNRQAIDVAHLNAASAWIDYWEETVEYCFTTLAQQSFHEEILSIANDIVRLVKQLGNKNVTQSQIYRAITKNGTVKNMHSKLIRAVDYLQDESPARVCITKIRKKGTKKPTIVFNGC